MTESVLLRLGTEGGPSGKLTKSKGVHFKGLGLRFGQQGSRCWSSSTADVHLTGLGFVRLEGTFVAVLVGHTGDKLHNCAFCV